VTGEYRQRRKVRARLPEKESGEREKTDEDGGVEQEGDQILAEEPGIPGCAGRVVG
jgi:hypothetical protein